MIRALNIVRVTPILIGIIMTAWAVACDPKTTPQDPTRPVDYNHYMFMLQGGLLITVAGALVAGKALNYILILSPTIATFFFLLRYHLRNSGYIHRVVLGLDDTVFSSMTGGKAIPDYRFILFNLVLQVAVILSIYKPHLFQPNERYNRLPGYLKWVLFWKSDDELTWATGALMYGVPYSVISTLAILKIFP